MWFKYPMSLIMESRDRSVGLPASYLGGLSYNLGQDTHNPDCFSWLSSVPPGNCREGRCSSYSLSTSALDGSEWSASHPDSALPLGKGQPVPIVQEAGWTPEPVWTQRLEEKSFRLCRRSNRNRPLVQSVARHYTDWATRLTFIACAPYNNLFFQFLRKKVKFSVQLTAVNLPEQNIQERNNSAKAMKKCTNELVNHM
jgi:hypothetical protein